jgi:hypothetical protein
MGRDLNIPRPSAQAVHEAVEVLRRAGFALVTPEPPADGWSVGTVAARLDCCEKWVRENIKEFPGAFLLGREWRIPRAAVQDYISRRRVTA